MPPASGPSPVTSSPHIPQFGDQAHDLSSAQWIDNRTERPNSWHAGMSWPTTSSPHMDEDNRFRAGGSSSGRRDLSASAPSNVNKNEKAAKKGKKSLWKKSLMIGGGVAAISTAFSLITSIPLMGLGGSVVGLSILDGVMDALLTSLIVAALLSNLSKFQKLQKDLEKEEKEPSREFGGMSGQQNTPDQVAQLQARINMLENQLRMTQIQNMNNMNHTSYASAA